MQQRLARFTEVWAVDFEFTAPLGERPCPLCVVARELRSGRIIRQWLQSSAPSYPPYSIGADSLVIAYYASAEMGCHLSLNWPMPANILDLYAEFRRHTSGLMSPTGYSLLGALGYFGLDAMAAVEKSAMRELAQRGGAYSDREQMLLMDYCQDDVDALARLLPAMLPTIDLPRALLRGRYMQAAARIEWQGVPLDVPALTTLRENWWAIQYRLVSKIDNGRGIYQDAGQGVFDRISFCSDRFASWLVSEHIAWPRLESGALDLSDECFREMSKSHPAQIGPIRELRHALSQLRLESLAVGRDGRNRCLLSAFASKTGRNQPSNSASIFGPSTWLRSLIRPEEGRAVAYLDYEQQEFGIAAALSGDRAMQDAYRSGDPYLTFARQARAVPADATAQSHATERERFKTLSLAVQYGMGCDSLSRKLDTSTALARELIQKHRETYPSYWRWSDAAEMRAMLYGSLSATYGWTVHVGQETNPRSLRNFPLQANGAEMLRLACILTTEAGIQVCAPVHDALLIEGPSDEIDAIVEYTQLLMQRASEYVLPGFPLRTDAKVVRFPDRFVDRRGKYFWETVWELVAIKSDTPFGTEVIPPSGLHINKYIYRKEEREEKTPVYRREEETSNGRFVLHDYINASSGLGVTAFEESKTSEGEQTGSLSTRAGTMAMDRESRESATEGIVCRPDSLEMERHSTQLHRPFFSEESNRAGKSAERAQSHSCPGESRPDFDREASGPCVESDVAGQSDRDDDTLAERAAIAAETMYAGVTDFDFGGV